MRLCREIENRVDLMLAHSRFHSFGIADIILQEDVPSGELRSNVTQVIEVAPVV